MRITFHGHRPSCVRRDDSDEQNATARPANPENAHGESVRTVTMGFVKMKIYRQTAIQAALLRDIKQAGPRSKEQFEAHWNAWAQAGGTTGGDRTEAVSRMMVCLNNRSETTLDLSGLNLNSLPNHLPNSIHTLNVSRNRLTSLPNYLPLSLKTLHAKTNSLTSLPNVLPQSLQTLNVQGNSLTSLPNNLPRSLRNLNFIRNQMTSLLPEEIARLPQTLEVNLEGNPFPRHVYDSLDMAVTTPGYRGPTLRLGIHHEVIANMNNNAANAPTRPLADAVAAWFEPGDQEEVRRIWSALPDNDNEQGQAAFSKFLDRLSNTSHATSQQSRQSTVEWLSHLADNASLRDKTFSISIDATIRCNDRVSLTLNDMKKARLAADVEAGVYDQRLPDLIDLARGMFRLDKLEKIAQEKTKLVGDKEAVEVYLAYQVKLRVQLSLPVDVSDMIFFRVSDVTKDDLDSASKRVQESEASEFFDYLSTDWDPWQSVLMRLDRSKVMAADQRLATALETEFPVRVAARLKDLGLENDDDAQRTIGVAVKEEINREIKGDLTRSFLRTNDLSDLLP